MAPTIGFTFLLLVILSAALLAFLGFNLILKKKTDQILGINPRQFLIFASAAILLSAVGSQLCLTYSFITSDFSVANVYNNSHSLKPLIYKISGSWGNHEGSMLLLITILAAYAVAFMLFSKVDFAMKVAVISCQSLIILLFAAFTAFVSNPFLRIFPIPLNGLGLNPILQDIGLAMHPPMLYTGYIGFSLVFSFATAALIKGEVTNNFAKCLKPWLYFSYGFLTLGIGLGAWWAYRELGWGGYWFWDPVENVSLMPWLAATALIHCLKLLEQKEICKIWTILLAILSFILCLIGIFLVRSGVLTSVHSFAVDARRGFFMITLILGIGGAGLLLFGMRWNVLKTDIPKIFLTSKVGIILINNYLLVVALFTVFLGTLYPIFSQAFFNQLISIGPDYYNKICGVLLLPFLLFLALVSQLNYQNPIDKKKILNLRNILILLGSIAFTGMVIFYHHPINFLASVNLFLAIFAAMMTIFTKNFRQQLNMKLAHSGFALIIVGIIFSSCFAEVKELDLKQKQGLDVAGYNLEFADIIYVQGKNFVARQGDFLVTKNQRIITTLHPQLRYYPELNQTTNESSIWHGIFGDLYLVIGNKDDADNYAIRAYYKPMVYLIWGGCLMIFVAVMRAIYQRVRK